MPLPQANQVVQENIPPRQVVQASEEEASARIRVRPLADLIPDPKPSKKEGNFLVQYD